MTPEGKLRYNRTEASSDAMKVVGNKKAANDAFKNENKLQKKYKKALKSNDANKINSAKQSIDKFKSDKNKLYKNLGMNKKEMKFRDVEASYNNRIKKAAVAGGVLATSLAALSPGLISAGMLSSSAIMGAMTGVLGSSITRKGHSYIEAYKNAYNDFKKTQGHNTRTII